MEGRETRKRKLQEMLAQQIQQHLQQQSEQYEQEQIELQKQLQGEERMISVLSSILNIEDVEFLRQFQDIAKDDVKVIITYKINKLL